MLPRYFFSRTAIRSKSRSCGSNSTKRIWPGRPNGSGSRLEYKIENIRFTHDPDWNTRMFSLQAAHDGKGLFWGTVHVIAGWSAVSI